MQPSLLFLGKNNPSMPYAALINKIRTFKIFFSEEANGGSSCFETNALPHDYLGWLPPLANLPVHKANKVLSFSTRAESRDASVTRSCLLMICGRIFVNPILPSQEGISAKLKRR
ncbi:unnamed protein product [Bemisia tabaci]|uniref:Uncharacterized protein n=1 Tax=Bemisia tabaci TaxID=7038 RepID=A0A9P0A7Y0_BEMTA|nr:unnamed protein product [Bemisia tabaci]